MKKEKTPTLEEANGEAIREDFKVYEEQMKTQKESEKAAENIDSVPEPNVEVLDENIELSDSENKELTDNADYLEYSAEVVGYANREIQFDTYHTIVNYISIEDSVLDFGCGRGDFERFCQTEYNVKTDYLGIDMNKRLIDAGKKAYNNEVNLQCIDWFSLDKNIKRDWCINIGSNNLRYDADTVKTDLSYLHDTIDVMMKHANKGIAILLASENVNHDDGLINWNAGDLLNWSIKKYGNVALDHSMSNDIFVLVIYKK